MTQLSVIILNYNAPGFLELCVDSVSRAIQSMDAEIIVVDNASQGQDFTFLDSYPKVRFTQSGQNSGFAAGNNLGIAEAQGEFLCILNPDTIVPEDVFENFIHFFESYKTHKELGFVGPRLIDGAGSFLPECKRNVPTPSVALSKLAGSSGKYYASQIEEKERGEVDVLVGAFIFCRKQVYLDCGGLDERYFMYGEDIDLCYTAALKGYTNFYLGDQTVIHFKGESTRKDATYRKHFYNAMRLFYDKHFGRSLSMKVLVSLSARVLPLVSGRRPDETSALTFKNGIVITHAVEVGIFNWLSPKSICAPKEIMEFDENQIIIFDTAAIDYQIIIDIINSFANDLRNYRFLSRKRDFLLGSDTADGRGGIAYRDNKGL